MLCARTASQCYRTHIYSSRALYPRLFSTEKPSLPVPPASPSSRHHDLQSFLAYAKRTALSTRSTTYVGTLYEYTVQQSLKRHCIDLTRIGGRSDCGIDLVGTWALPPASAQPLRILVQCKAVKAKVGPNLIRELEGTFSGAPVGWRGEGILGMLVSTREATKGVRDTLIKSRYPLIWALADLDGSMRQFLWNRRAAEVGLEGLGVQIRHGGETDPMKKTVVLTWNGEEIEPEALKTG
ncbi:hypothetical protein MGYG_02326 [Nannizzia gypsea CBS 118893]|uniref:Uncharacterized protein n=1 Tax=Arthroderma gypseum (strain ATCC MYA-4604 / CBS 118893) TaxID=535722 RepID=E4UQY7_ARTGP|nr:hypothetical protein MGYG_02326 [Nannizzia gypsea CBS 118893]EFQ99313.1 hypothetical protein MGYG_02326 [Nannizzia gypsea CBS 118893]